MTDIKDLGELNLDPICEPLHFENTTIPEWPKTVDIGAKTPNDIIESIGKELGLTPEAMMNFGTHLAEIDIVIQVKEDGHFHVKNIKFPNRGLFKPTGA